jgi:hypothetical protein
MAAAIVQRFPRRQDGVITHKTWEVDLAAAAKLNALRGRAAERLQTEASEMATHFGRWLLTVSRRGERLRCGQCGGMWVFDRGVRCVACDAVAQKLGRDARLAWFGLLPPIAFDSLTAVAPAILSKPPAEHLVGENAELGHFLLVPLCVEYPADFPESPVGVHYLPGFFTIKGVPAPRVSHEIHLLNDRMMCLFTQSQWQPSLTCREVLQQRAYAHVIKLLNYANGKRDAFGIVTRR